jgi:hypothetical protein
MFVRCAFFKGNIKPGMEDAFHAHWRALSDIDEALASPTRWASKETSKKLFEMFDGHVIHTVFEAYEFDPITT